MAGLVFCLSGNQWAGVKGATLSMSVYLSSPLEITHLKNLTKARYNEVGLCLLTFLIGCLAT